MPQPAHNPITQQSHATAGPAAPHSPTPQTGIDPRGQRFNAAITATLLLIVVVLALSGAATAALIALSAIAALFAWGTFAGIRRHPYGIVFRALVRPRLAPQSEWEDPRPPTLAQGVGLVVTGIGVILGLLGLPVAVGIAAAAAFVAAFLNAAFGYCLGCQIYVLLVRLRG